MNNERQLIAFDERPKQIFLNNDISMIPDNYLLSVIINPNCKYKDEFENYNKLLQELKGITNLVNLTYKELKKIKGISFNDSIRLLSSIELGRRVYYNDCIEKIKLNSADKIFEYMKYELKDKQQEHFFALYLDSKKCLIQKKLLFVGTLNKSIVHPREIFKYAYLLSASSIVCVHNHPSGDTNPSFDDISATRDLVNIGRIHGIDIADHIIIGKTYYSFYENGNI